MSESAAAISGPFGAGVHTPPPDFIGFELDSPRLRKIRRVTFIISVVFHLAILTLFLLNSMGLLAPKTETIEVDISQLQNEKMLLSKLPPEIKQIKKVIKMDLSEVPIVSEAPPPVKIPEELMKMPELSNFDVGDEGAPFVYSGKGGNIQVPQMIQNTKPTYPETMRRLGQEGDVKVSFIVHKDGSVSDAKVVDGRAEFGQSVLDMLHRVQFTPALKDGRPITLKLVMKFKFRLTGVQVGPSIEEE